MPRAIGTGAEQDRDALRAAELRSLPRPSRLEAPVASLDGVGPSLAEAAAEIGIETLGDLLWHVPHGHRDRAGVRDVADLRIGEQATVMVSVRSARVRPTRRRNLRLVEAAVADDSGPMKAVWFNQAYLAERLQPGTRLLLNGKLDRSGFRVATHEIVAGGRAGSGPAGLHTTGIVPVHNASARLSANRLREWVWQAVDRAADAIEPLPAELRARRGLAAEADALRCAHFPDSPDEARAARDRLAFEELCLHQVALGDAARRPRGRPRGDRDRADGRARRRGGSPRCRSSPPPTSARRSPRSTPTSASGRPMQRLLMGEVGSGKTVVAVYAMLRALEAGHQAAMMAPTETLAEQHAATLDRLLGGEAIPFALLTGATPAARRRETLDRLRDRRARAGHRHPRADRARRRVRPARGLRRRRAAPLRRAPAGGARRQGDRRPRPRTSST